MNSRPITKPSYDFAPHFDGEPTLKLAAGEILFERGQASDAMYVVLSGVLKIGSNNIVFEKVGRGSIIGEMGLIDEDPRSARVTAVSDAELVKIDAKRFQALIQADPMFAVRVMRVLTHRLRKTNERLQPA